MDKGDYKLISILLVFCLAAGSFLLLSGTVDPASIGDIIPDKPNPTISPTFPAGSTYGTAAVQLEVIDAVLGTGVTTATTTVDVFAATNGEWQFLDRAKFDTKAQAANPQAMNTPWAEGTELLFHVSCTGNPTNGLDYYDTLYRTVIGQGNPVYRVEQANLVERLSAGKFYYRFSAVNAEQVGTCTWAAGTTPYWNVGKLALYPRISAAGADIKASYDGTLLASVTDGSSMVDTVAEITANATLASRVGEKVTVSLTGEHANLGFGKALPVISASGQLTWYPAVVVMSTNMMGISIADLQADGWVPIQTGILYNELAFYKVVDPSKVGVAGQLMPSQGQKVKLEVSVPITSVSAAGSTAYVFKFWVMDVANIASLSAGSDTTTMPTAYGFSAIGVGARIHNAAFTISSGAGATSMLMSYLTTAT